MADENDEKDLNYYIEHPDEIPNDPAALEAMADGLAKEGEIGYGENGATGNQLVPGYDGNPSDDGQQEEKADPEKKDGDDTSVAASGDGNNSEGAGTAVSTKDGKGTIPYSVLAGSRQENEKLRLENEELRQEKTDAETQDPKGDEGGDKPGESEGDGGDATVTPESEFERRSGMSLDDYREEYGEAGANLELNRIKDEMSRQDRERARDDKLKAEELAKQESEEDRIKREAGEASQALIDSVPQLAQWQQDARNGDDTNWNKAIELDNFYRDHPLTKDLSPEERFAKVVTDMDSEKPAGSSTPNPSDTPKQGEKPSPADAGSTPPTSFSDFPAGGDADQTEVDRYKTATPLELEELMENPKRMEEILSQI